MFRDLLGWPLVVDHRGRYVRLQKRLGARADASRPAIAPGRTSAFTIRRYVLFCVACAELDSISETQTILSRLADGVTKGPFLPRSSETLSPISENPQARSAKLPRLTSPGRAAQA